MLEPYRDHRPVLAVTVSVVAAIVVFALATSLIFSLVGWAFDLLWFVGRLAVIAALIGLGIHLLRRVSR
ncbi:MAG TPA: hypothetical protein VLL25_05480 [Acidimicrobiales bacterium]|nr:hypothetical protein [Acidimicrobiales bacterium]